MSDHGRAVCTEEFTSLAEGPILCGGWRVQLFEDGCLKVELLRPFEKGDWRATVNTPAITAHHLAGFLEVDTADRGRVVDRTIRFVAPMPEEGE